MTTLAFSQVERTFSGEIPVHALVDATTVIAQGDYVAIEGPSGSGKSTFLNLLALLDAPTSGEYHIDGSDVAGLGDRERARFRSDTFSFVFQSFHLLPARTVLANVMLGLGYRALDGNVAQDAALEALRFVGLEHKASFRAAKLSGGESQRVAIARAIATGAPILVADEPTGNLDSVSSQGILDLLDRLNTQGKTVIVVTHDPNVADRASRRLLILDGVMHEKEIDRGVLPPSKRVAASPPPGKASTVRMRSFMEDAWASVTSVVSRSVSLVAMVVLGVGLALTTIGLSQTARYQVTDAFDANLNRRVGIASSEQVERLMEDSNQASLDRVLAVPGVEAASFISDHDKVGVSSRMQDPPEDYGLFGIYPAMPSQEIIEVDRHGNPNLPLADDEVIIGAGVATALDVGPIVTSPTIWVSGVPFRVVGTVLASGIRSELSNSVLMNQKAASGIAKVYSAGLEIRTLPGSAQQVAKYAPLAWDPVAVDGMAISAPEDPTSMRDTIDQSVQAILLTLSVVAVAAALLALTNAMASSVQRRTTELGLRRAIGARRIHIANLIITESAILGLAGGLIGTVLAIITILGVTIAQRWQPVMDFRLVPLGILGGVIVGILGSLAATRRATHITPAQALRSQ